MKNLLFICLVFILNSNLSIAQIRNFIGNPLIQNYTLDFFQNITNSSKIYDIAQDSRGLIYLANDEGIIEYDGSFWKLMQNQFNTEVYCFAESRDQTIYVGSQGDFGYLSAKENGTLKIESLLGKIQKEVPLLGEVNKIAIHEPFTYFSTNEKIYCLTPDSIYIIGIPLGFKAYKAINRLFITKTNENGLFLVQDNSLVLLPSTKKFKIANLFQFDNERIWIITEDEKSYIYNLNTILNSSNQNFNELTDILPSSFNFPEKIQPKNLTSLVNLKNGNFAIGTTNSGLFIFNSDGNLIKNFTIKNGLLSNSINCLFFDLNNLLWIGQDNGLSKLDLSSPISIFDGSYGYEGIPLISTYFNKRYYLATHDRLYCTPVIQNRNEINKLLYRPIKNTFFKTNNFKVINNQLFALTDKGIVSIVDTIVDEISKISDVFDICHTKRFPDNLFIATLNGLYATETPVSNDSKGKLTIINTYKFADIQIPVKKISTDEYGDLWISTFYSGIYNLSFPGDELNRHNIIKYNKDHGLPSLNGNLIYFINNEIIVATRNGLYKGIRQAGREGLYNFIPDRSLQLKKNEGELFIKGIVLDNNQNKWILTEKDGFGDIIQQDSKNVWNSMNYSRIPKYGIHNLYIDQFNFLWILRSDKIYCYDLNFQKDLTKPFKAYIREMSIKGDSIIYLGGLPNVSIQTKLSKGILNKQPQEFISVLTYKYNTLSFKFSSNFYEDEEKTEYQYILVGRDSIISDWTTNKIVKFNELKAGDYILKVAAKNIYGTISEEAIFQFRISPAWYNSLYAYIVYLVLGFILIYGLIKFSSNWLKSMNLRLDQVVKERTYEISKQNEEILKQNQEIYTQKEELTKQARLLEATNQELEMLSLVASGTDNAILIMDEKGNFEWVNDCYTRMFGYTLEELKSQVSENIIGKDTSQYIKDLINKCIQDKIKVDYEFSIMSREGMEMWIQATISPILDKEGNLRKIIAVDTDITKIKVVEQEIFDVNKEISNQKEILETEKQEKYKILKSIDDFGDFSEKLTHSFELDYIFNTVGNLIHKLLNIDTYGIGIYNSKKELIEFPFFIERGEPHAYFTNELTQEDSLSIWCYKNKKCVFINDLKHEYRNYIFELSLENYESPESLIYYPILIRDEVFGVLTIHGYIKNAFDQQTLSLIRILATLIGYNIDISELNKIQKSKNILINTSASYATLLQQNLLPQKKDMDKVFNSFIVFKPKGFVSGDFYWFQRLKSEDLLSRSIFVVADCTGHGTSGAFMTILGNYLLREIVVMEGIEQPGKILEELNLKFKGVLKQDIPKSENDDSIDVGICYLEQLVDGGMKVIFAGAKQSLIYYSKITAQVNMLHGNRKSIGGVRSQMNLNFDESQVALARGDIMYMYTDGLIDQISPERKKFGTKRLTDIIQNIGFLSLKDQKSNIETSFEVFRQHEEQRDDVTFIGIEP